MSNANISWKLYCIFPVLILTVYFVTKTPTMLSHVSDTPVVKHDNVFALLVNLEFSSEDDKTTFINLFKPMAEYVKLHEPTTLTYALGESDKDSKLIVIIERYVNKAAYLDIHKKSAQFIAFRQELSNFGDRVKISGNSYVEKA